MPEKYSTAWFLGLLETLMTEENYIKVQEAYQRQRDQTELEQEETYITMFEYPENFRG